MQSADRQQVISKMPSTSHLHFLMRWRLLFYQTLPFQSVGDVAQV